MPMGPGKYDDVCTDVLEKTKARGVIVIVLDGSLGHGFSVQADAATTFMLPEMLRRVADEVEHSLYGDSEH